MNRLLKFSSIALVVMLVLTIAPVLAQDGVTFNWGTFGNPVTMDGQNTTDGISFRVITQGCEALLKFEGDGMIPHLATSWETSEDGLTWVFQLRDDVTFHDGTPFNAEAVAWNYNRWAFTDHPQHFEDFAFTYYRWLFGGYDDASLLSSIEATGEYEVTFTLVQPNGVFLTNTAITMTAIHSPTAVEAAGNLYGTPEVGFTCTGPYTFVEWIPDQQVILERNADYWGDNPSNIDQINFRVIPDNAVRYAALQAGEIDAMEQPNVEDIAGIESADDTYVLYRPPMNIFYLAYNYRIQELRDVRVRQAISMAIDREAIVEAFYPPGAIAASTLIPPGLFGRNADIPVTEYDPEGALALLAEAGYPDGFSEMTILAMDEDGNVTDEVEEVRPFTFWYQPVTRPYNPDPQGIGEAMASYLADIGIEMAMETREWGEYLDARTAGELYGLYQLGWSADTADPDNFAGTFFVGTNVPDPNAGWYMNEELDALLREARGLSDPAVRGPLYEQADQMMLDDVSRMWIAHAQVPLAFNSCVSGYITHPLAEYYSNVTLDCD